MILRIHWHYSRSSASIPANAKAVSTSKFKLPPFYSQIALESRYAMLLSVIFPLAASCNFADRDSNSVDS